MFKARTIALSAAAIATASLAFAAGHGGNPAVKARQSHMQLYQFNLTTLGNMAKGDLAYDAEAASAAANNIASLSKLSQNGYWAPGSDNGALGDETRALPALWQEGSKAGEFSGQLAEAADALAAVAGDGQEALGPAVGALGQACNACHKEYRQSNN
jgi:cytochrome c556